MENNTLSAALVSQYRASLCMLRQTITAVPGPLWNSADYENRSWRLAYHVVWSVNFYLNASPEAYVPWDNAIQGAESLGAWWDDPGAKDELEEYHTPEEVLAFIDSIEAGLRERIASIPFEAGSGFEWYPFSRFELHINTIRHIQHHTGQLIERLKAWGISGFEWK